MSLQSLNSFQLYICIPQLYFVYLENKTKKILIKREISFFFLFLLLFNIVCCTQFALNGSVSQREKMMDIEKVTPRVCLCKQIIRKSFSNNFRGFYFTGSRGTVLGLYDTMLMFRICLGHQTSLCGTHTHIPRTPFFGLHVKYALRSIHICVGHLQQLLYIFVLFRQ